MSYFDRSNQERQPRRQTAARQWADKPLSNAQKSTLARAAKAAFQVQCEAGLAEGSEEEFRRQQVLVACGKAGLREADNRHFRSILAHFQRLAGDEEKAKQTWAKTGRVAGSNEIQDTHENRETARAVLRDLIAMSGGAIGDAYVAAIVSQKFSGKALENLRASQLQDLVFTVTQRLRKKCPHLPI